MHIHSFFMYFLGGREGVVNENAFKVDMNRLQEINAQKIIIDLYYRPKLKCIFMQVCFKSL